MRNVLMSLILGLAHVAVANSLEIHTSDSVLCAGEIAVLEATAGFTNYTWNTGDSGRITRTDDAGWYIVEAQDRLGNTHKDSIYITKYSRQELEYHTSSDSLCKGDSVVIELSEGFTSYWWSTGHRSDRAVLTPTATQRIVVEAVDSNGCDARLEFVITVNDCDSCDVLYHDSISKCGVDSLVLEAKYGYAHYEWQDGSKGRLFTVKRSGWYSVEVEDSSFYCTDSIYVSLNEGKELRYEMEPEDGVICKGDSVLIELTNGFEYYWWNTGHRYNRAVIYPERSKVVVIEAKDSNGCEDRIEIEIAVEDCEDCEIFEKDSLFRCGEDSVILEAPSGHKHYLWQNGSTDRLHIVKTSGWYVLEIEDSGYYCVDSIYVDLDHSKRLEVHTNPANRRICHGDSIVIELGGGFDHYWWNTGHRGQRNVLYPRANMKIVVEAKDSNGCDGRAEFTIEVVRCHATVKAHGQGVKWYPNPANDLLTVELDDPNFIGQKLSVFNGHGQTLLEETIIGLRTQLDTKDLPTGFVMIRIGHHYFRVLIMH